MVFRQLFDHETWTFTYLLADVASKEAILIDPVLGQLERDLHLLEELNLNLKYVLDTHVHADHVTAAGALRERTGCLTGVSVQNNVGCIDLHLKNGECLSFGEQQLKVLETPGHTNGCLSFVWAKRVFTGDTLFIRGCGRTDFQQGSADQLYDSIMQKIYSLPDDTLVYPGHDYRGMCVSSIAEEKAHNPRLRLGRAGFVDFMQNLKLANPKKIHEAVPANLSCGQKI